MPKLRSNINKNNSPGVREDLGSLGVPVGIRVRSEALLVATQAMFTPTAPDEIFDWLKNLTGHFVDTEPFNIFALFTRNFERLDVGKGGGSV